MAAEEARARFGWLGDVWRAVRRAVAFGGRLAFNRVTLLLAAVAACVDLWWETRGVPEALRTRVESALSGPSCPVSVGSLRAGLLRGVVCHEVRVSAETPAGRVEARLGTVALAPDWTELLRGRVRVSGVVCTGVEAVLEGAPELSLTRATATLRLDGGGRLTASVSGAVGGVALSCEASFADGGAWVTERLSGRGLGRSGASGDWRASVSALSRRYGELFPAGGGSSVRVSVCGRLSSPEELSVTGHVALREVPVAGLGLLNGHGRFAGGWECLELTGLRLMTAEADELHGRVWLYGASGEAAAEFGGRVGGALLRRLASGEASSLPEWLLPREVPFEGRLERSRLERGGLRGRLVCGLPVGHYGALGRVRGEVSLSLSGDELSVSVSGERLSSGGGRLSSSGRVWLSDGRMEGRAEASVRLAGLLEQAGVEVPSKVLLVSDGLCRLSVDWSGALGAWRGVSATGWVSQSGGRLLGMPCGEVRVPFALEGGVLRVDEMTATHRDGGHPFVRLRASCDVAHGLETGEFAVGLSSLELDGALEGGGGWGRALSLAGQVRWRPDGRRLAFAMRGAAYPQRLHQAYLRRLDIDRSEMLKHIDCAEGAPLRFTLSLPETSPQDDWRLEGSLAFGRVTFNGVRWERVECPQFVIAGDYCDFRRILGRTEAGDEASFDLHVGYRPFLLRFSDAVCRGDPRIVGAFLLNDAVHSAYLGIFRDLTWGERHRPLVRMPGLTLHGRDGRVVCEGLYVNAREVRYRQLELDEVNGVVSLNLPQGLTVEPATVHRGDWMVSGRVSVELTGTPVCRFEVYRTRLGVDVPYVLSGLLPEQGELWRRLSLSPASEVECVGSVTLGGGEPEVRLRGRLRTPQASWDGYGLEEAEASWSYGDGTLFVDVARARYAGGQVRGTGRYSPGRREGDLALSVSDVRLSEVRLRPGEESEGKGLVGRLSGEAQIHARHDWGGRDWHLEGRGQVSVRDGELWKVPVLSALGRALKAATLDSVTGGLGQITSLDMEALLEGHRLRLARLSTDGTIVSLDGRGSYEWGERLTEGRVQVEVSGVPVRGVRLLSWVLSPVTGLFQAELSGPLGACGWRLRTFLGKLF